MKKRDKIEEIAGSNLHFMDPVFDSALIGFAECGSSTSGGVKACYGYQALKSILCDNNNVQPAEVYARLKMHLSSAWTGNKDKMPILLMKIRGNKLWNIIKNNNFPVWDYFHKAVLGICMHNWQYNGVIYNKQKCIDILSTYQSYNKDSSLERHLQSSNVLDNTVISLDLGINTPWFLTHVK